MSGGGEGGKSGAAGDVSLCKTCKISMMFFLVVEIDCVFFFGVCTNKVFMLTTFKPDCNIMKHTTLIFVMKYANCVTGVLLTALLFALDLASLEPS